MTFKTTITLTMDVEYYRADYFSTIPPYERELLTRDERKNITKKQKISIEETDKVLVIQNELRKIKPSDLVGELLYLFDKENKYNVRIGDIKWSHPLKSVRHKDTFLPDINIILYSSKPLDKEELHNSIYYTGFLDDYRYNKGVNNGWTWYSFDYECEYARTRIIKVSVF
jgi:hypothetical protein